MGLRPVRRAKKLCYSKVLQSRSVREDFCFFHGTRSHPTVPEPVPTQLVKKPAVPRLLSKAFPHIFQTVFSQFCITFSPKMGAGGCPETPKSEPRWPSAAPDRIFIKFASIFDSILGALGDPRGYFWATLAAAGAFFPNF